MKTNNKKGGIASFFMVYIQRGGQIENIRPFCHSELLYYCKPVVKTPKLIDLPPKSRKIWRLFGLCPQNDGKCILTLGLSRKNCEFDN